MKFRGFIVGGALALALALTACGGGSGGADGGPATLEVGTGEGAELVFDPTTIQAPANTAVQLVFTNESDSQPHNLAFKEGIQEKTADLVQPGQSQTISFTTPGPGSYTYVCTIHPGMEGTLTVQ